MAKVEAIIIDLNRSVTWTILKRYSPKHTAKVTKVAPTACVTIPGYLISKIAEIPPMNKPSKTAYPGAK